MLWPFEKNLFEEQGAFFGPHKNDVHGYGRKLFQQLKDLLDDPKISLQTRVDTIKEIAESMDKCAGGVVTKLVEGIAALSSRVSGLDGSIYHLKIQMIEAFILEHVRATHPLKNEYEISCEVHFVNAYFNHIAEELGVPKRLDQNIALVKPQISEPQLQQCKKKLFLKCKPEAFANTMATDYLDSIKDAANDRKIPLQRTLEKSQLASAIEMINDLQKTQLDQKYGSVWPGHYLQQIGESFDFRLSDSPMLLAIHFYENLKKSGLIDHVDPIVLAHKDSEAGTINMLGPWIWLEHQGAKQEICLTDLMKFTPSAIAQTVAKQTQLSKSEYELALQKLTDHVAQLCQADSSADLSEQWQALLSLRKSSVLGNPNRSIQVGSAVSIRDDRGERALLSAVQNGDAEFLRMLLASINSHLGKAEFLGSALEVAIRSNHPECLELLIDAGANKQINIPEKNRQISLLTLAAAENRLACLNLLLNAEANNLANSYTHEMALISAVKNGHADCISTLLENSVHINLPGTPRTILGTAAKAGHANCVKTLIEKGADIEAVDNEHSDDRGSTALLIAASSGQHECLLELLNAGASSAATDKQGNTAAHHSARLGNLRSLTALIAVDAPLDSQNKRGDTPLTIAAANNQSAVVTALLAAGANPRIKNKNGETAEMMLAEHLQHESHVAAMSNQIVATDGWFASLFKSLTR